MKLNKLALCGFRNFRAVTLSCASGVNLIVGANAQGKTNLLEAIGYLGCGRSFRTSKNVELVRFGGEAAEINADIFAQERAQTLRYLLFSGQRPRQIYQNGVKRRSPSEFSGVFRTVLFCPEDLMVLRGGAAGRRKLADAALCQLRPNYEAALAEYGRILERKSKILRDRFENPALLAILPEYNERLCQVGALLISYRARFFDSLGKAAARYHAAFSGEREEFTLTYRTVSTICDPFASILSITEQLRAHMESHARAELESAQCLTGPHKDDFETALSGLPAKSFASQGQLRTATISLKLAQRELMAREGGEMPVLLLDDVLSELDAARQDFVLNQISGGQVFITCCEPGRFTKLGQTVEIREGELVI